MPGLPSGGGVACAPPPRRPLGEYQILRIKAIDDIFVDGEPYVMMLLILRSTDTIFF
jgi:hypothetical protein